MKSPVGVLGLGAMGGAVAARLAADGAHSVLGWDPNDQVWASLAGSRVVRSQSVADLVACVDTLLIVVASDPALTDLVRAALTAAAPPAVIVVMGTHSPAVSQEMAERAAGRGIPILQAPVSGGRDRALAGQLTIIGSGPHEAWDSVLPLMEHLAARVFYCGDGVGAQALKLVNNLLTVVNLFATAEALTLADRHGLSLTLVRDVISTSSGSSRKFVETINRLIDDEPLTGSRARLRILLKDIGLALDSSPVDPQPLARASQALLGRIVEDGFGDRDVEFIVPWTLAQKNEDLLAQQSPDV